MKFLTHYTAFIVGVFVGMALFSILEVPCGLS